MKPLLLGTAETAGAFSDLFTLIDRKHKLHSKKDVSPRVFPPYASASFSSLRDTGSCLIEQIDPLATEMYLSHSEPGMKRHYAHRDWARLERALGQLWERLSGVLTESQ